MLHTECLHIIISFLQVNKRITIVILKYGICLTLLTFYKDRTKMNENSMPVCLTYNFLLPNLSQVLLNANSSHKYAFIKVHLVNLVLA